MAETETASFVPPSNQAQCSRCFPLQVPNFLMSQVRKLNENSSRRYQFYDRRIKNLLRKIHTDSREKPDKNSSEVSAFRTDAMGPRNAPSTRPLLTL